MTTSTHRSAPAAPGPDGATDPGAPHPDTRSDQAQRRAPGATRAGRRRPRWWLELLAVAWLLWIYDALANLEAVRAGAAHAHGLAVLRLEQRLHLDPERVLDHWLAHHPLLGLVAGDYYTNAHFVVTFAVVGWLWWRHPGSYRPLRTTLVLINVIGFAVYWRYPMAPPRMLAGQGFADIVASTHALGGWGSGAVSGAANQYAAMPSLHLAWASWSALAVWSVFRHRRWAAAAWLYPALTVVVVLATGNHLLADCVAGVATTALAGVVAFGAHRRASRRLGRRREHPDGAGPLLSATAPPPERRARRARVS